MTDKKDYSAAFASGRKEIVLPYKDTTVTFYVNELGFLASQDIALKAAQENKNALALIVVDVVLNSRCSRASRRSGAIPAFDIASIF